MLKTTWRCSKSISTGAQYVTLDNKIKCLSFAVFFFGNPTNKTVIGTEYMWGLLIANHLDQSLWSANQKYWAAVKSNLLHAFVEVHNFVVPFTSHGKLYEFGAKKPISWAKPAHFDFFALNFTVWSHMLSTTWRCSKTLAFRAKAHAAMADSAKCAHSRRASPLRYGGFCQVATPPEAYHNGLAT